MAYEQIVRDNMKKTDYVRGLYQSGALTEDAAVDQLMNMGADTLEMVGRDYFLENPDEADRLFVAPSWMKGFFDQNNRPMCYESPFEPYIELLAFHSSSEPKPGKEMMLENPQGCVAEVMVERVEPYSSKLQRHKNADRIYRVNGTVDRYTAMTPQQMYLVQYPDHYIILLEATGYTRDMLRQGFQTYFNFINRTYAEVRGYYKALLK